MIEQLELQNHPKTIHDEADYNSIKCTSLQGIKGRKETKLHVQGDVRAALNQWESATLARAFFKSATSEYVELRKTIAGTPKNVQSSPGST